MNLCASRYGIVLAALAFMGVSISQSPAAEVPPSLAVLLSSALSKADKVIRERHAPNATMSRSPP